MRNQAFVNCLLDCLVSIDVRDSLVLSIVNAGQSRNIRICRDRNIRTCRDQDRYNGMFVMTIKQKFRQNMSRWINLAGSVFSVICGLVITIGMIFGMMAFFQSVMVSSQTKEVLVLLDRLEMSIRRIHANLPYFGEYFMDSYLKSDRESARIFTPWSGEIVAAGGRGGPGLTHLTTSTGEEHHENFYISVLDLPESACEGIASAYLNRRIVESIHVVGDASNFRTALDPASPETEGIIYDTCKKGNENRVSIIFKGHVLD